MAIFRSPFSGFSVTGTGARPNRLMLEGGNGTPIGSVMGPVIGATTGGSMGTPITPAAAATPANTVSAQALQSEIEIKAQQLANQMMQQLASQNQQAASGRVFTRFDYSSDIIENQKTFVTTGLWSGNAATMSAVYTSSLQSTASKSYYYEVWDGTSAVAEPQFAVAYGHRLGSGSSAAGTLNDSPSRAVYSQYRLLLLNPTDTTFTFADGDSSNSIFALNFNRARVKDKLDPGNWELHLSNLNGSSYANNVHTGSNVTALATNIISLVDDSGDTQEALTLTAAGRVFNIVSGTLTGGIYNPNSPDYYGLAYPDMGVIVLNGNALNTNLNFNIVSGSNVAGDNAWKLYTSISGAMADDPLNRAFQARNEETVTSTHYFVRVKNGEYNFSNNPTFVTGSVGEFSQATFIGDPKVYITTVGMYNDRQELLAVAKLSQPVQKSFSNEALIKVKLDF